MDKYVSIDCLGDKDYYGSYGAIVIADKITPAITNMTIKHSEYPHINSWISGAKNINNTSSIINITQNSFSGNAIMPKINGGSFYRLLTPLTVNSGSKLTIQPGAYLEFPNYSINLTANGVWDGGGTLTGSIHFKGKSATSYSSYSKLWRYNLFK